MKYKKNYIYMCVCVGWCMTFSCSAPRTLLNAIHAKVEISNICFHRRSLQQQKPAVMWLIYQHQTQFVNCDSPWLYMLNERTVKSMQMNAVSYRMSDVKGQQWIITAHTNKKLHISMWEQLCHVITTVQTVNSDSLLLSSAADRWQKKEWKGKDPWV